MTNNLIVNTKNLQADLDWLEEVIDRRFKFTFTREYIDSSTYENKKYNDIEEIGPPDLQEDGSTYAQFVYQNELNFENRLLLILSLTTHISPHFLDRHLAGKYDEFKIKGSKSLNELGGITSENYRGFIPTGLTWLFLLAGHSLQKRIEMLASINENHLFIKDGIMMFDPTHPQEPVLSGAIGINPDWLRLLTIGDIQIS
ncbi:MAG: hypothetical protein ACJ77K_14835 [Bacteroidia bacterium]